MHKWRKTTSLVILSLLLSVGCSQQKEELKPAKNNNQLQNEVVEGDNKVSSAIINKYKKSFGDLKYSTLPNERGVINVENVKEILGDDYNTFITAFSLEPNESDKLRNVVLAEHSIHIEDKFKEDDLNLKTIYNLLKSQSTTVFKDLKYKEFIEYLNKTLVVGNNKQFTVSDTKEEYINIIRRNSKVTLTVCNIDTVDNEQEDYEMKNYSYKDFLELMYNGNTNLINKLATALELKVEQPKGIASDRTVMGYVPSFKLSNGEVLDIGIVDGQSAESMREFNIDFKIKLQGELGSRLDTTLKTATAFLDSKFGVNLDYTEIINDAKTFEILDNFIREFEEIKQIKSMLNPNNDEKVLEYNPYLWDVNTLMTNDLFEFEIKIPIKVDGKRTK